MARIDVEPDSLTDGLRSELIFLPDDGRCFVVRDGDEAALVTLTPSNPTYWWGNCLRFAHPPRDGDFARWTALFAAQVHAVQPASTHTTFGWEGAVTGEIDAFLAAGFEYFETIALVAERGEPILAPHPAQDRAPLRIAGSRWDELLELLVVTRDDFHSEGPYRDFASRRIAGWQALEEKGQGAWFGIVDDDRLVSALGVFVEATAGADGRRIGRFQHVVTHPDARRRGYAGTLVAHASAYGFETLGVDALLIVADENDMARWIYEACGYRVTTWQRNLEFAPNR